MKVKIRPETVLYFDEMLRDMPELIWQASTLREAVEQGERLGEKRGEVRGEAHGKELGKVQEKQSILSQLLRRKFTDLPDSAITLVEQTNSPEQLEVWTFEILTANTWQEIFKDNIAVR